MRGTWLATVGMIVAAGTAGAQEHEHQGHQPGMTMAAADSAAGDRTPLYDNLGTYHMTVTTASPVAQQYFDQGLRLTYGFNHDEAIKSYREGIREDSTCAMCWWGVAYALGPNINVPMDTAAVRPAWEAVQQAVRLAPGVSPREQAYIRALQSRYSSDPAAARPPLDSAWARAIGEVARRYPKDDDAATLHAEALMDLRPWNYWNNAGKPRAPSTLETVAILERVVKRRLDHPGACHFYIHAIEASTFAARAVPCAERLGSLVPGAGHLVHMPTHIYMRLGRWDEAVEDNTHAAHVDSEYLAARHPTGVYPIGYVPHNYHVMWEALSMLGRSEEALTAARTIVDKVPADVVRMIPPFEYYSPVVLFTLARFSRWDDILKEAAPAPDLRYTTGVWHYARGLAYAAKGALDSAAAERDSVAAIAAAIPPEATANLNSMRTLLQIGERHLAGALAAGRKQTDDAVRALRAGIALEDELTYDEPSAWAVPLRQQLGAVLLAAGRPKEAETAYREDLVRYPNNGWSLHGLAESLKAQGRAKEAEAADAKFRKAWERADVKPLAEAF
jgi:tetratricopeptide (TPR) repeat protein